MRGLLAGGGVRPPGSSRSALRGPLTEEAGPRFTLPALRRGGNGTNGSRRTDSGEWPTCGSPDAGRGGARLVLPDTGEYHAGGPSNATTWTTHGGGGERSWAAGYVH